MVVYAAVFVLLLLLPGIVAGVAQALGRNRALSAALGGTVVAAYVAILAVQPYEDLGPQGHVMLLLYTVTAGALVIFLGLWLTGRAS